MKTSFVQSRTCILSQLSPPLQQTGVYRISTPSVNDLVYIGSAARSFVRRWAVHKSDLKRRVHHSRRLQAVVNKHGLNVLVFEVLEFCVADKCIETEQKHLDFYPRSQLYNTNPVAGSRLGAKLTFDQCLILAASRGGVASLSTLQTIVAEYEEGAKQTELAKKYQVNRSSIRNYLQRLGGNIRQLPSRNWTLSQRITERYLAGNSLQELSKAFKLDYGTVKRLLVSSGVKLRENVERQRLRFGKRDERINLAVNKGGEIYTFIHRKFGRFTGYQFELAEKFGLKSSGNLTQLVKGRRLAYQGWEMASSELEHVWKRPASRADYRGKDHHSFGRHASEETRKRMSLSRRKLSDLQIREIEFLLREGTTQSEIARQFRINQSVVSRIKTRSRGYGPTNTKRSGQGA